jgi:hypothetical protein
VRREQRSDVGFAQGSENGVHKRVQERIPVGVAKRTTVKGNPDPPQHKLSALDKGVLVQAKAGSKPA